MDIYTAAGLQPPYKYPGTARTNSTSLVGPVETATAITGILLRRSPSLLYTDSPNSSSSPPLPFLASTSNRYNSYRAISRTAQVAYSTRYELVIPNK
jgi:hypothetical protein